MPKKAFRQDYRIYKMLFPCTSIYESCVTKIAFSPGQLGLVTYVVDRPRFSQVHVFQDKCFDLQG